MPPAELEALLLTMEQIKDCVVIPVLDEEAGELPRAYVVPQDGVIVLQEGDKTDGALTLSERQVLDYVAVSLCLSFSLRFQGIFLYTSGVLINVGWCIRHFWCSSIISFNVTSISYNYHTDIYPLSNIQTYKHTYLQAKVAPYKKLRGGVKFVEAVPKSPSGKLLRRVQIQMDRGEI